MANFTFPDNNVSGIIEFLNYTNSTTGGFLGIGILIIIGFVSFFATKSYTSERAMAFAGFITLISAILMRFIGLINDQTMFIVIVLFVLSVIFLMRERDIEEV